MTSYSLIAKNEDNDFYEVTSNEICEVESSLGFKIPHELKSFYLEVGYGFIKGSEYSINRIMDPESVCDFRKREADYECYPDIEIYDDYEDGKLIFFECSESALISIDLNDGIENPIYYYDKQIAPSLKEFLIKMSQNDRYYCNL
ncbi:SMI1/KNR4 family protein [Paenibacillus sp. CAU 1782]